MNNVLKKYSWSPYTVGGLLGLISIASYALVGKQLGTSAPLVYLAGYITKIFNSAYVLNSPYYIKYMANKPLVGWGAILFVMLFIGSFVSSILGNSRTKNEIPEIWRKRFGSSLRRRYFWSVIGGILLGFGARMAGGCTSGHSISGGLMLALSGWVFTAVLFVVGVIAAFIIYRR